MSVCVRVDDDLVAEFRNISNAEKAVPSASIAERPVTGADSCAEAGVATPATLAELQASSDKAAAAGCRAA
jgi:hypothetical protein